METARLVNHILPAALVETLRHPRSLDEAREFVARQPETSCLAIGKKAGKYVFEEILCRDRTSIDRSRNVFAAIKKLIRQCDISLREERYIFHYKGDACDLRPGIALLSNSRAVGNDEIVLWPLLLKKEYVFNPWKYREHLHDELTRFTITPDHVPWKEKNPVFFFRGMNSGNPFPAVRYPWNRGRASRCQLLLQAARLPADLLPMIDVGFNKLYPRTRLLQANYWREGFLEGRYGQYLRDGATIAELRQEIEFTLSSLKPSIARSRIYRNRYIICPEGFDCASSLPWVLASNCIAICPPFHYENVAIDSSALKPYVHYLPIRENYSDLPEVMRWALEHDEECQQIVTNANEYVTPLIDDERMMRVQIQVLNKILS